VLKHLRRIEVPGGIAHAFNGSRQQADQFQAMGFALGFGGTLSFEGSRRIRSLAATLPESAIVLETDAPDIAPAWRRGGRSEPAFVARYATILAELRGVGAAEVAAFTTANARRVLPRMDSAWQALGGG
jgi:TatD DNase family protein